jgi:uncharacterized membrane protein
MRNWRGITWTIIVWIVGNVVWVIAEGSSASSTCTRGVYQTACKTGAGISVTVTIFVAVSGLVVLTFAWFVTGRDRRNCPDCRSPVRRGRTVCLRCGYDFADPTGERMLSGRG